MAKPVKVHELNKDDEIWFRASEHNISYPAVVVDLIDDFESGNLDVLIGTQMVSKGLNFALLLITSKSIRAIRAFGKYCFTSSSIRSVPGVRFT